MVGAVGTYTDCKYGNQPPWRGNVAGGRSRDVSYRGTNVQSDCTGIQSAVDELSAVDQLYGSIRTSEAGKTFDEGLTQSLRDATGGKPLSPAERAFFEPRFGRNFGDVRIHTGSKAADLNRKLGARAFAHGADLYFGQGQYRPNSTAGKRLLAHELTHVVQATRGPGTGSPTSPNQPVLRQGTSDGESSAGSSEPGWPDHGTRRALKQQRERWSQNGRYVLPPGRLPHPESLYEDPPPLGEHSSEEDHVGHFLGILGAFDLPGVASVQIVRQIEAGNYYEAAKNLTFEGLGVLFKFVEIGYLSVAAFLKIAWEVMEGVLMIPIEVNDMKYKQYFVPDYTGILTAYIYNDDSINPHDRLGEEAEENVRLGKRTESESYTRDAEKKLSALVEAVKQANKKWNEIRRDRKTLRAMKEVFDGDATAFWRDFAEKLIEGDVHEEEVMWHVDDVIEDMED